MGRKSEFKRYIVQNHVNGKGSSVFYICDTQRPVVKVGKTRKYNPVKKDGEALVFTDINAANTFCREMNNLHKLKIMSSRVEKFKELNKVMNEE